MRVVVGLGNPGAKYRGTRHNVGFDVIACLAERFFVGRCKAKFNAEIAEVSVRNEKVVLVSPLTFMNLSGQSVRAAVDFYKLPIESLLVICDDINLDLGRLRFRPSGSAGGQNGLKDIIQKLGSQSFSRLRVGVGKAPAGWDAADFVLGKFSAEEQPLIDTSVVRAANAVEEWVASGVQVAMNLYNRDPAKPKDKSTPVDVRSSGGNQANLRGQASGENRPSDTSQSSEEKQN